MGNNTGWTRHQLLIAFNLYCQMPFGKMHSRNPQIIKYASLIDRTPSALAMKLTNLASLDPAIRSTGRKGLEGASAADKAMWQEMQNDWEAFVVKSQSAINSLDVPVDNLEKESGDELDYSAHDKLAILKIRVGQNFFRRSVLSAYGYRCCITGLSIPKLLVASHIVPWKTDKINRLNPKNGLCLSALHCANNQLLQLFRPKIG